MNLKAEIVKLTLIQLPFDLLNI